MRFIISLSFLVLFNFTAVFAKDKIILSDYLATRDHVGGSRIQNNHDEALEVAIATFLT